MALASAIILGFKGAVVDLKEKRTEKSTQASARRLS